LAARSEHQERRHSELVVVQAKEGCTGTMLTSCVVKSFVLPNLGYEVVCDVFGFLGEKRR